MRNAQPGPAAEEVFLQVLVLSLAVLVLFIFHLQHARPAFKVWVDELQETGTETTRSCLCITCPCFCEVELLSLYIGCLHGHVAFSHPLRSL